MKEINKYVQLVVLITGIGLGIASLFKSELAIYLMVWTLPLGFTQYLGSMIDTIIHRGKSTYLLHLIISTVILVILMIGSYLGVSISHDIDKVLVGLCGLASACLAVYFWILTFRKEELNNTAHSVLDL